MARCEDFPCCGHEHGCCPDFDESGRQLNMKCVCGATVPIDSRYSICEGCMRDSDDPYDRDEYWDDRDDEDDVDESMDGDFDSAMRDAGHGMDEDYGDWGQNDEF